MSGEGMIPMDSAWQPQEQNRTVICDGGPLSGTSLTLPDDAIGFKFTTTRLAGEYREIGGSNPRRFEWTETQRQ